MKVGPDFYKMALNPAFMSSFCILLSVLSLEVYWGELITQKHYGLPVSGLNTGECPAGDCGGAVSTYAKDACSPLSFPMLCSAQLLPTPSLSHPSINPANCLAQTQAGCFYRHRCSRKNSERATFGLKSEGWEEAGHARNEGRVSQREGTA